MKMTKMVNVFDQTEREIRCIEKEHDYLGNGERIVENELEIGRIYTYIHGRAASYGNMVFLKEHPSRWGYQAYLFEELNPYDEEAYIRESRRWLIEKLEKGRNTADTGEDHLTGQELRDGIRKRYSASLWEQEIFEPGFTDGHDPGAAYWIYPVCASNSEIIEFSDIEKYEEYEISIPGQYFDPLLIDFFTDGIDPEYPMNAQRYSTDDVPDGIPIYGFAWHLHPNFYTYDQMDRILQRMRTLAEALRAGQTGMSSERQKSRLKKAFAAAAEKTDLTYEGAMRVTADFYEKLAVRFKKMMSECTTTQVLCVMVP